MIELQESVSLFHSLYDETVKQVPINKNDAENKPSIKSLAIAFLNKKKIQQDIKTKDILAAFIHPDINILPKVIERDELFANYSLPSASLPLDNAESGQTLITRKVSKILLNADNCLDYLAMAKRDLDEATYELFEERAAIMEFDSGVSRYIAEARSYLGIKNNTRK